MNNSALLKYFIAFLLPMYVGAQSTSSASIRIQLGDFHQIALPNMGGQTVFLNLNTNKNNVEVEEGDFPILLSSTGVFNLFARTASQNFSTLNLASLLPQTLLGLEVDGSEYYGNQLAKIKTNLDVGFKDIGLGQVSADYTKAIKNKQLIVASQSLIRYGRPTMNKALKFKYIVSSKEALDFLKETDPDSAEKAVIYTITSN